jgi:hypothetical protein
MYIDEFYQILTQNAITDTSILIEMLGTVDFKSDSKSVFRDRIYPELLNKITNFDDLLKISQYQSNCNILAYSPSFKSISKAEQILSLYNSLAKCKDNISWISGSELSQISKS